ncbi:MAG: acyl-CoA thioesterase [Muribaculaceae bacterium]|nr:acyl-CoA thioesterase [Muribaculaceae bacterium]
MDNNIKQSTHLQVTEHPFRCTTEVQLRFNDIDMLGHMNNTSYFQLFDLGKNDYFTKVKHGYIEWSKPPLMIVNLNIDFLAQTRFNERVTVLTQTLRLGEKSVHMLQQLINADTGEVKCQCRSVLVHFDVESGTPTPITQAWRDDIAAFEQRSVD